MKCETCGQRIKALDYTVITYVVERHPDARFCSKELLSQALADKGWSIRVKTW